MYLTYLGLLALTLRASAIGVGSDPVSRFVSIDKKSSSFVASGKSDLVSV